MSTKPLSKRALHVLHKKALGNRQPYEKSPKPVRYQIWVEDDKETKVTELVPAKDFWELNNKCWRLELEVKRLRRLNRKARTAAAIYPTR